MEKYEELNKLINRAKGGCLDSKSKIVLNVEGLLVNKVNKYYYSLDNYEDTLQECKIIVLESIDSYDISYGVHYLGYLKSKLRFYLLRKLNENSLNCIDNKLKDTDGIDIFDTLEDENMNIEENYILRLENIGLREKLNKLSDRQKQVIILYYFENMNMKDIANKLNISYRTVVNTKTSGIKKLRNLY